MVIACAADGRYALPLAVMLKSAVANLHPDMAVEIHAVNDGIDPASLERVVAQLPSRASLHWVDRPQGEFDDLPNWGRMTRTTYHKLTLGDWLPAHVDRALWLDCDALVLGDLARLWTMDLGRHLALAARDVVVPLVSSRFGISAYRDLGMASDVEYFNAGIMLIDVMRWRREHIAARAGAYLRRYGKQVWFWDQEALNAVVAGQWGALDPRWNWNPLIDRLATGTPRPADPWIVHFSGNFKPWTYRGSSRYHALYYQWIDQTGWSGFRPAHSWRGRAMAAYEASRLRSLLYPLEQFHVRLVRALFHE